MIAFKLLRKRRDGTLGPLFINRQQWIHSGIWLTAESHPTKGFAVRPGWHCTLKPLAPHLSMKGRVWCLVVVDDCVEYTRPARQGGKWVLAQNMYLVTELPEDLCPRC
jgi:hypothetical protein